MSDQDLHLLTGAYVLDGLDDIDRIRFEQHMAHCEACRTEVGELADTMAEVGISEQVPPPSRLRSDTMAAVRTQPQVTPRPGSVVRSGRWSRMVIGLGMAAAVAVAFALGVRVGSPEVGSPPQGSEQLVADGTQMLRATPDAELMPMEMSNEATVALVVSKSQDRALLAAEDLPMPPDGQVYQFWLVDAAGSTHPMDTFTPDDSGRAVMVLSADFADASQLEITMEPPGGSTEPSGPSVGRLPMGSA